LLRRAFTLIELLIVVAVIAILAAIAVPNFLEAQVRSKVSRVANDLRTLDTALMAYFTDNQRFPPTVNFFTPLPSARLAPLVTPVAYVSSLPRDPFLRRQTGVFEQTVLTIDPAEPMDLYIYNTASADFGLGGPPTVQGASQFSLSSGGPDLILEFPYYAFAPTFVSTNVHLSYIYDPTNGTVSRGEIFRRGGVVPANVPGLRP
jgi:prepilin-type N-terminal cleavage/methylation domain-containing protein